MFFIKLVQHFTKPYSIRLTLQPSLHSYFQRIFCRNKITNAESIKSQLAQDVLLYKYERTPFIILINLFSLIQCGVWSYLGWFLNKSLKDNEVKEKSKMLWKQIYLPENFSGKTICFVTVGFGWIILFGVMFYSVRNIREITLHKGGRNLTIITYNLPGLNNCIKVPLSKVSAAVHRDEAKKFIPLKIGGRSFYYAVDMKGKFLNPTLFDFTVGIKRSIN